jgi:hypothetical protein
MTKRVDHIASFEAIDSDGGRHVLDVFVDIVSVATLDNPKAERPGLKSIKTSKGQHVNRLEKGKYEVVETGLTLESTDPNAL